MWFARRGPAGRDSWPGRAWRHWRVRRSLVVTRRPWRINDRDMVECSANRARGCWRSPTASQEGVALKHSQHSRPLMSGVFLGALAPALIMAALLTILLKSIAIPALSALIIVFPVCVIADLGIGIPLALWLRSKGRLTALPLCLAGLVAGAVLMTAFNYLLALQWGVHSQDFAQWTAQPSTLSSAMFGAAMGMLSAFTFCLGAGIGFRQIRPMPPVVHAP